MGKLLYTQRHTDFNILSVFMGDKKKYVSDYLEQLICWFRLCSFSSLATFVIPTAFTLILLILLIVLQNPCSPLALPWAIRDCLCSCAAECLLPVRRSGITLARIIFQVPILLRDIKPAISVIIPALILQELFDNLFCSPITDKAGEKRVLFSSLAGDPKALSNQCVHSEPSLEGFATRIDNVSNGGCTSTPHAPYPPTVPLCLLQTDTELTALSIHFRRRNTPPPVLLSIPGSSTFANIHTAPHMHSAHPPHLLSYSRSIPSVIRSIFAFGGEIHPPPIVLSIPSPTVFANAHASPHAHPTHSPSLYFYSRPILCAMHSVFASGVKYPALCRSLDLHLHPVHASPPTHPTHPLSLHFYSGPISSAWRLVVLFGGEISRSRQCSCPALPKLLSTISTNCMVSLTVRWVDNNPWDPCIHSDLVRKFVLAYMKLLVDISVQ